MLDKKAQNKEARKRKLALQKKYEVRISIVKRGKDSFNKKDFVRAAASYQEYLQIYTELFEVENIYKLNPSHFDSKRQLTEMLLISQLFWDLARINENSPQLQSAFMLNLSQFVKFTVNQPYQVLNAEMLRKYIKNNKRKSPQLDKFNQAYQQIYVQSKKCYISTLCFGQDDIKTLKFRKIKDQLCNSNMGLRFIGFYYKYSSSFVGFLEGKPLIRNFFVFFTKPTLTLLARFISYKRS